MTSRGRPRRSIERARTFGRLVERKLTNGETLEAALMSLHRAGHWGSRRTMMRLWAEYLADQQSPRVETYIAYKPDRDRMRAYFAKWLQRHSRPRKAEPAKTQ